MEKGITLCPADYERWRDGSLGAVTERIELDLVLDLARPLAEKHVLDVGCGDGMLSAAAAARGAHVTGMDTSLEMLEAARRRASSQGVVIQFEHGDVGALPFRDASFDVVLAVTVLCFVGDAAAALREIARVLVPGGRLVLGDLGRWNLWAGRRYLRGLLGSQTWRGVRFRTARELKALVRSAGLELGPTRGAVYYPPVGLAARLLGPFDPRPRGLTTFGAAFLAIAASKPDPCTN
jgi:ubiquinone biosynthesis O-methyltransferase